jgi:hypothetical protein
MLIVSCAKDPEIFRLVGSAQGKRFDVVDLEIVGAVAFAT